jgi:hypothetical protein
MKLTPSTGLPPPGTGLAPCRTAIPPAPKNGLHRLPPASTGCAPPPPYTPLAVEGPLPPRFWARQRPSIRLQGRTLMHVKTLAFFSIKYQTYV